MDQGEARRRFATGAFIICLDFPSGQPLQVGIDGSTWMVGPKFRGLKMIPAGLHYFYYR